MRPAEPGGRSTASGRRPGAASIDAGGQGLAVASGARGVGAEYLEEVEVLLARLLVVAHALEEVVEASLDVVVGRRFRAESGDGRNPACLGGLGDAGEESQGLLAVAAVG